MERQTSVMALAGVFALLLLFGCLGGRPTEGGQQTGTPPQSQPGTSGATQPGGQIGDADISGSADEPEAELPGDDLIPPPDASASDISDADVDIGAMDEDYVISDEDIVEPA